MGSERARELLARERTRIEEALGMHRGDGPLEGDAQREPGEEGSENLYEDELAAGRIEDLREQMAALERAEARLQAGTYGLSVRSGEPIPDGRLEARPTAEYTVEEQQARERS
jgi:DnaK suppressor protein